MDEGDAIDTLDPELHAIEQRLKVGLRRRPALPRRVTTGSLMASRFWNLCAAVLLTVTLGYLFLSDVPPPAPQALRSKPVLTEDAQPPKEKTPPKPELMTETLSLKELIETAQKKEAVLQGLFPELMLVGDKAQKKKDTPAPPVIAERIVEICRAMLSPKPELVLSADAMALTIVKATPADCAEFLRLLAALNADAGGRELINTEVRILSMPPEAARALLADFKQQSAEPASLTPHELKRLTDLAERDHRIAFVQCPRLTMFPARGATVSIGKQHNYIADYDIDGAGVFDPVIKSFFAGLRVSVRSWKGSERLRVSIQIENSELLGIERRFMDVATIPRAKAEKGRPALPSLPIEFPKVRTATGSMLADIADGSTLVGCILPPAEKPDGLPVIGRVSEPGKFANVENQNKKEVMPANVMMLLVSPRLIEFDEKEERL